MSKLQNLLFEGINFSGFWFAGSDVMRELRELKEQLSRKEQQPDGEQDYFLLPRLLKASLKIPASVTGCS